MRKISRKVDKRGQMQIPFGMIFSIILIIAFIAVAFYAIRVFLNFQKCSRVGVFKEDFQEAIDLAWSSPETSANFKIILPSGVNYVCFLDIAENAKGKNALFYDELVLFGEGEYNMFFYPPGKSCTGLEGFKLRHINISEITKVENPYCVEVEKDLRLDKGFYDALVKIR